MSDNPEPTESKVRLFGYDVSTRGLLAFVSIVSLYGLAFRDPDLFGKAAESIAIAIVGFYFGQNSKKS